MTDYTSHRCFICALALCALACTEAPDSAPEGPLIRDSSGVRIVENGVATWATPWQVVDEPSLRIAGVDEETGGSLYQVTGAIRLEDGRIVVANSGTYELRFYSKSGEFVSSSGGRGGGPGEFSSIEWIARFGPDSILAVDVQNHRVSYFDTHGEFGRAVRLEPTAEIPLPRALGVFSDGSLLATKGLFVLGASPPTRVERIEQQLFRYEPDGKTAKIIGSFPGVERAVFPTGRVTPSGNPEYVRLARRFGANTAYAADRDRFYVADNAKYEIKAYSMNGVQTHLFRKQHTHLMVTDADASRLEDSVFANESDLVLRRSWQNRPATPSVMPAYAADIHIDYDLNLWVREYTRPGQRSSIYSVFDSSGVLLGEVAVPNGLTLLDIGQAYVLGLLRDELDVEHIQLHELSKSR